MLKSRPEMAPSSSGAVAASRPFPLLEPPGLRLSSERRILLSSRRPLCRPRRRVAVPCERRRELQSIGMNMNVSINLFPLHNILFRHQIRSMSGLPAAAAAADWRARDQRGDRPPTVGRRSSPGQRDRRRRRRHPPDSSREGEAVASGVVTWRLI